MIILSFIHFFRVFYSLYSIQYFFYFFKSLFYYYSQYFSSIFFSIRYSTFSLLVLKFRSFQLSPFHPFILSPIFSSNVSLPRFPIFYNSFYILYVSDTFLFQLSLIYTVPVPLFRQYIFHHPYLFFILYSPLSWYPSPISFLISLYLFSPFLFYPILSFHSIFRVPFSLLIPLSLFSSSSSLPRFDAYT